MLGMVKARSEAMCGPIHSDRAKSRPSVGTARAEFASATSHRPRPLCPIHSPSGIAIADAMSRTSAVIDRCSCSRVGMPTGPRQLSAAVSQAQNDVVMPPSRRCSRASTG